MIFVFRRHRAITPNQSPYVVLQDTIRVDSATVNLQLLNKLTNVKLMLELSGLEQNTARIKVDEAEPSRKRYEIPVGDVLVEEPKKHGLVLISHYQW